MKRLFAFMLLCALLFAGAACRPGGGPMKSAAPAKEAYIPEEEPAKAEEESEAADIDLTTMGSTMVYSQVYDMMTNPAFYLGRTVKVRGPYYTSQNQGTGQYYHFIIVSDATACCEQGIEFIWNGEHAYPEDYPENRALSEITGVFSSYEEEGNTYYYLAVDDIHAVK